MGGVEAKDVNSGSDAGVVHIQGCHLIGSRRILEPSMPRNNYTTEGKASNLLRHPLYSRIFSGPFGPTGYCAQAVVEYSMES